MPEGPKGGLPCCPLRSKQQYPTQARPSVTHSGSSQLSFVLDHSFSQCVMLTFGYVCTKYLTHPCLSSVYTSLTYSVCMCSIVLHWRGRCRRRCFIWLQTGSDGTTHRRTARARTGQYKHTRPECLSVFLSLSTVYIPLLAPKGGVGV